MILVTKECWDKIKAVANAFAPYEVSFYGYVTKEENESGGSVLNLVDILVPKNQTITQGTVKTDHAGDAEAIVWQDELNEQRKDNGLVLAQFHTHPSFGVTPSGTDTSDWLDKAKSHDFYIVGIFNTKMEYTLRFLVHGSSFDVKFTTIEDFANPFKEWAETLAKEIKATAIKSTSKAYSSNYKNYWGQYLDIDDDDYSGYRFGYEKEKYYGSKKKSEATKSSTLSFLGYDFKGDAAIFFPSLLCAFKSSEIEENDIIKKELIKASAHMTPEEYQRRMKVAKSYAYILYPSISFGERKDFIRVFDTAQNRVCAYSLFSLTERERGLLITPECHKRNSILLNNEVDAINESRYDLILANKRRTFAYSTEKVLNLDTLTIVNYEDCINCEIFDSTDQLVKDRIPIWWDGVFVCIAKEDTKKSTPEINIKEERNED